MNLPTNYIIHIPEEKDYLPVLRKLEKMRVLWDSGEKPTVHTEYWKDEGESFCVYSYSSTRIFRGDLSGIKKNYPEYPIITAKEFLKGWKIKPMKYAVIENLTSTLSPVIVNYFATEKEAKAFAKTLTKATEIKIAQILYEAGFEKKMRLRKV